MPLTPFRFSRMRPALPLVLLTMVTGFATVGFAQVTPSDDGGGNGPLTCATNCVPRFFTGIAAQITTINLQLITPIGLAIDSIGASTALGIERLQQTSVELELIAIDQQQILEEKIQTLEANREVRQAFGSAISSHCDQVSAFGESLAGTTPLTPDNTQARAAAKIARDERLGDVRTEVARLGLLREQFPIYQVLVEDFARGEPISEAMEPVAQEALDFVVETRFFPAPAIEPRGIGQSIYKQAWRDRQSRLSLVRVVLQDALTFKVQNIDGELAEFTRDVLEISDSQVSADQLLSAVGRSGFGDPDFGVEVTTARGDNLREIVSGEIAKRNFLLSKLLLAQSRNTMIESQIADLAAEQQMNPATIEAFRNAN